MLLERHVLHLLAAGLFVTALYACAGNQRSGDDAEILAALNETLGRLGTHDGAGFRAGFTVLGFEDFTREWWGVTGGLATAGLDLDAAVAEDAYRLEAASVAGGSGSRVEVLLREQDRPDLSEDRFLLVHSEGRWLIDGADRAAASPPVPAGYHSVPVEVREYAVAATGSLPSLPQATAFVVRNDGELAHEISLLWLEAGVPTEGFFFGVAEAWPPMMEWYGSIRVAPGETGAHSTAAAGTSRRAVRAVLHTWRAGTVACAARDAARTASALEPGGEHMLRHGANKRCEDG